MFDRKQVSSLICDELVEVNQAVKEDADLSVVLLQFLETEVTFF